MSQTQPHRQASVGGPTPAETRMYEVYDVFERLLNHKPHQAAQMAYEIAEVAQRYAPQPKGQKPNGND